MESAEYLFYFEQHQDLNFCQAYVLENIFDPNSSKFFHFTI